MVFRHLVSGSLLAALLSGHAFPAEPTLPTLPAFTFFSTLTEEPLARLEAESIGPRFVQHGPFQIPAPGVTIESPSLTLHDQPCTADDWARVLRELVRFQTAPGSIQLMVTLPGERSFVCQRPPAVSSGMLSGLVRPLNPEKGKPAEPLLLRITHDGKDRLRAEFRPLPAAGSRHVAIQVVEPEPDTSEPFSPVPPPSVESSASP